MYFKDNLTKKEYDTLKCIYEYGGYVRVKFLDGNFENVDYNTLYRRLENLAKDKKKYLSKRKFWSESRQEPITYQITKKGCSMVGNPNSHYKRKHKIQYSYRALIKSLFCFEQHKKLKDQLITNHEERLNIFKKYNFKEEFFPRKYNKYDSFIHFEEFIIDFTSTDSKLELLCNDRLIYDNSKPNIVIIHIDKNESSVPIQLDTLIKRYEKIIEFGGEVDINFLIVTDKIIRKIAYGKEIRDRFSDKKDYKFSKRVVDLYYNFLKKCYENDTEMIKKLNSKLANGELENELKSRGMVEINELNSDLNTIKNEVNTKSFNYIVSRIKDIAKGIGNYRDSIDLVNIFIDDLLKLEYNGYIDLGSDFGLEYDVKVYTVSEKIV